MKTLFKLSVIQPIFLFLTAFLSLSLLAQGKEVDYSQAPAEVIVTKSVYPTSVEEIIDYAYHYPNRMVVFNLYYLSYEHIEPDSVYVGLSYWKSYPLIAHTPHRHLPIGKISNGEFDLGYHFYYLSKDHFTPLVGIGVFNDSTKTRIVYTERTSHTNGLPKTTTVVSHKNVHLSPIAYGTVGFLYEHEFNNRVSLGFNLRGMVGRPTKHKHWGSRVIGYHLDVPLTLRLGKTRHWDLRLDPFYINLEGQRFTQEYFGFNNSIGYRF
jgi:hypothetical protein